MEPKQEEPTPEDAQFVTQKTAQKPNVFLNLPAFFKIDIRDFAEKDFFSVQEKK